ncbi:ParA family protein [Spiroplasma poulsonii]|uniref:Chromosome partitioning protein ParA n=1 Tax=Spiroplasma poulsonii TaxID=2138 RepID=A0A2R6Y5Q1_9MOLU|nr:ParA family protein [Spiroplasma poulsonii]KAF0849762.1 Chromosome partitioning protein ParA [Spiroplasma poulsonii]PTQ58144.1 Chromosome partitioning protein ParA [Spiroplasma poulsonii]PWF94092.1 Chromosome partitioning protein ParA [Spiroplasma poulsonii]PWF94218.1 Chromosome partitioning protein ParA [Spiroplasma poulsonii]PWF94266.1 Chromosome partitioning protein ParA [Spiroplasma poulsonii]
MKMISFAVKKGGAGKTTLCKNVAYKLALDEVKVLLIDLDPQATLTLNLVNNVYHKNKTIKSVLTEPELIKIAQIIQETKYKNIDIIVGGEQLNKVSAILNLNYSNEKDQHLIADTLYMQNDKTFDSYDYVLIDYPPTINELSVSFLMLSDLIIAPLTDDGGCYKGVLDLKNTLNYIAKIINKEPPNIKILLNNVKNNDVTETIWEWLKNDNLTQYLLKCEIKHSDTFSKNTVKLDTIWTNPTYWRQKQAYEELIKEIK